MRIEQVRIDPRCSIETLEDDYARFYVPPNEKFHVKVSKSGETDWFVELLLEGIVKVGIDAYNIYIDRLLSNCGEVHTDSRTSTEDRWAKDIYITDLSGGEYVISITYHEDKIYSMLKKNFNGTVQLAVDVEIEI